MDFAARHGLGRRGPLRVHPGKVIAVSNFSPQRIPARLGCFSRTFWQLFRKLLAENVYIDERLLDRRLKLLGPPAL
jgi:hypothetical protein